MTYYCNDIDAYSMKYILEYIQELCTVLFDDNCTLICMLETICWKHSLLAITIYEYSTNYNDIFCYGSGSLYCETGAILLVPQRREHTCATFKT